MLYNFMIR